MCGTEPRVAATASIDCHGIAGRLTEPQAYQTSLPAMSAELPHPHLVVLAVLTVYAAVLHAGAGLKALLPQ